MKNSWRGGIATQFLRPFLYLTTPMRLIAAAVIALVLPQAARADDTPRRGGTLEFASTVEPGN